MKKKWIIYFLIITTIIALLSGAVFITTQNIQSTIVVAIFLVIIFTVITCTIVQWREMLLLCVVLLIIGFFNTTAINTIVIGFFFNTVYLKLKYIPHHLQMEERNANGMEKSQDRKSLWWMWLFPWMLPWVWYQRKRKQLVKSEQSDKIRSSLCKGVTTFYSMCIYFQKLSPRKQFRGLLFVHIFIVLFHHISACNNQAVTSSKA